MRDYKKVEEILKEFMRLNGEIMTKFRSKEKEMESALMIFGMSAVQQLPVSDLPDDCLDEHFQLMSRVAKGQLAQ